MPTSAVAARLIVPVAVVLGLTIAGFVVARELGERDARRVSAYRAKLASTEIRTGVEQGADVVESLRRFLVGHVSSRITNEQFVEVGSRWLDPVGLDTAAWAESVPATERAAYERRLGRRIVTTARSGAFATAGPQPSYLPATLVTRVSPMSEQGIDLGAEPGLAAAAARRRTRHHVTATGLVRLRDGTMGLFLVRAAGARSGPDLEPGFAVLFVRYSWLLAGATAATPDPRVQLTVGGGSVGALDGAATARSTFTALGQRFEVRVPQRSVQGPALLLPWIILAAGVLLAALAGKISVNAAQRSAERSRLLADALGAEERERRTLAEALHDHALQNLLSARHQLEEAGETLAHPALARADDAIVDTIRQLRDAVFELHPYVLEEAGLKAALLSIAQRAATRAGLDLQLDLRYENRHPREPLLFSVGRELLSNVVRHADASQVSVSLVERDDELELTVEDDGRGFPPERLAERLADGHVGLASQRFRLEAAGGSMDIAATPGLGTRVAIRLPAR
jgi:signal transduction histidine kinase